MEKKSIFLCALIIFEKINLRAACVAAATHLHDSHDKVMGEKKTTPCRAPLCGELSLDDDAWKKSSTRLFLFFFYVAWLLQATPRALAFRRESYFQASPLVWKTAETEHCCSCCLGKTRRCISLSSTRFGPQGSSGCGWSSEVLWFSEAWLLSAAPPPSSS